MEFNRAVSGQCGCVRSVCWSLRIRLIVASLLASEVDALVWRVSFLDDHTSFVARSMYVVAWVDHWRPLSGPVGEDWQM